MKRIAIVAASDAEDVEADLEAAGETVCRIGEVVPGRRGCTVDGAAGWGSDEGWTVTHHA